MIIPKFPRHMSPTERGIERRRIVNLIIADITAINPGKTLNTDTMTAAFLNIVTITWHADRIADLERRLEAMDAAAQPAPAPAHKRATLKLRTGNSNG